MAVSVSGPATFNEGLRKMAWSKGWCSYWMSKGRVNPYPKRAEPELFALYERGFYEACKKFGAPCP